MKLIRMMLPALALLLVSTAIAQGAASPTSTPATPESSFKASMEALKDGSGRSNVAALFRHTAEEFPEAPCELKARTLANHLDAMAEEDREWVEPESIEALDTKARIAYYVYNLRDLSGYGYDYPVPVLRMAELAEDIPNPAQELLRLGDEAIPALLALLDDPSPTRTVWHRRMAPYWSVLRYQDVAIQILGELAPAPFYRQTQSAVFYSGEKRTLQSEINRQYRSWFEKSEDKSEEERMWAAIDTVVGIYPTLSILETLALEHNQREKVMDALVAETTRRPPIQLPQLSYLMCRLGNTQFMDDAQAIWKSHRSGPFNSLPDDGAAISNAELHMFRQLILFGEERHHAYLLDIVHGRERVQFDLWLRDMCDLAANRWDRFPKEYDRNRFPLYLLIDAMSADKVQDAKGFRAPRKVDDIAIAIQAFTGIDFGIDQEGTIEARDAAIVKIKAWWEEQGGSL